MTSGLTDEQTKIVIDLLNDNIQFRDYISDNLIIISENITYMLACLDYKYKILMITFRNNIRARIIWYYHLENIILYDTYIFGLDFMYVTTFWHTIINKPTMLYICDDYIDNPKMRYVWEQVRKEKKLRRKQIKLIKRIKLILLKLEEYIPKQVSLIITMYI